VMRDTLSLKNTKLGLETLERMDYDRRRVKVLLNRANTNVGIERDDVLAILGRDVDFQLPSDREITRSINAGVPISLSRGSEPAAVFAAVAKQYIDASLRPGPVASVDPAAPLVEAPSKAVPAPRRPLFRRARGTA